MNLLIVASSRGVRRELIRQAVAAGHDVTILVPKRPFFRRKHAHVRLAVGDLFLPKTLIPAVTGQQAVICWLSMRSRRKPTTFFFEGTGNLMRAMYQCGVRRLVCVSACGVGDSRGHRGFFQDWIVQPLFQKGTFEDRRRQEELVRYTDLDWIIVRPAKVVRGEATGNYMSLTDLRNVHARTISCADVVEFALKQLNNNFYVHQTPLVTY